MPVKINFRCLNAHLCALLKKLRTKKKSLDTKTSPHTISFCDSWSAAVSDKRWITRTLTKRRHFLSLRVRMPGYQAIQPIRIICLRFSIIGQRSNIQSKTKGIVVAYRVYRGTDFDKWRYEFALQHQIGRVLRLWLVAIFFRSVQPHRCWCYKHSTNGSSNRGLNHHSANKRNPCSKKIEKPRDLYTD